MENSIKFIIFCQSIWNFVKITISYVLDVAAKSTWLDQNCGCYTTFNFLECLIFIVSDCCEVSERERDLAFFMFDLKIPRSKKDIIHIAHNMTMKRAGSKIWKSMIHQQIWCNFMSFHVFHHFVYVTLHLLFLKCTTLWFRYWNITEFFLIIFSGFQTYKVIHRNF